MTNLARNRLAPVAPPRLPVEFKLVPGSYVSAPPSRARPVEPNLGERFDALMVQADSPAAARLAEQYIFVVSQNKYVNRSSGDAISREALDASHTRDVSETVIYLPTGETDKQGRPIARRAKQAHQVVNHYSDQVDDFGWWPGKSERYKHQGRVLVNSFRPPPKPVPTTVAPAAWLNHLRWLVPDEAQVSHFLDVLAFNVQHLDGKVNHSIVIGGGLGIGKDLLLEPVRRWLKTAAAWRDVKTEQLDGQFSEYLHRAKVLCINESRDLSFETGFHRYNSLKTVIAAPPDDLSIQVKYLRDFTVPNLVQVVILTNYEAGVFFEDPDDRRYFVVWSDVKPKAPDYYAGLANWIDLHFMEAIGWLAQRDLAHFNPKAPPPGTAAREAMHTATRSGAELTLGEMVQDLAREKRVFTRGDMLERARRLGHHQLEVLLDNRSRVGKALKDAGVDRHESKRGGKKITVYFRRCDLTGHEAWAEYRRQNPGADPEEP